MIVKGERLGAVDAHKGDWVLSGKTIGGWKVGVCYRWTGSQWINLEPEYNYTEQYHACLFHICEIPELMKQTGHFGALFAKQLIAQEAFIKKLAADQAFLKELIVQRLKIDSDRNSDKDFEAWFDETNGLKINNGGKVLFVVDPTHGAYFSGSIYAGPLVLDNTPEKIPNYNKKSVATSELANFLYDKQHIPMEITINNKKHTLNRVEVQPKPIPPPNAINIDDKDNMFKNNSYYFHITMRNGYRNYWICDVYRHIVYNIGSFILLNGNGNPLYKSAKQADWWEKIATDIYFSGSPPSYNNVSTNKPQHTQNNEKITDKAISNVNIIFSPNHKLFKLEGLPTKKAGLSKNTVYIDGSGYLRISQ